MDQPAHLYIAWTVSIALITVQRRLGICRMQYVWYNNCGADPLVFASGQQLTI